MDIVCREDLNTIFWRDKGDHDWNWATLDDLIEAFELEPFTELTYEFPVRREGTDEILYHVFKCDECEKLIPTVDANHEYDYCPYCGCAILH